MFRFVSPLLLSSLLACQKAPPASSGTPPTDPLPIIIAAVGSGSALASLSGDVAEEKGDFVGCVASHSVAAALLTAGEGISGNLVGGTIPSVAYDISSCLGVLDEDGLEIVGEDVPALVEPVIDVLLNGAITIISAYEARLDCEARVWSLAAIEYTSNALPAILEEVEEPDGIVNLPGVAVGLDSCEEE